MTCTHGHPTGAHSRRYSADQCRPCWNAGAYERRPRVANVGARVSLAVVSSTQPCAHLGGVIDRLGCNCAKRWKYKCGLHGTCTTSQCDGVCTDYVSDATPDTSRRHLVFYVYPVSGNNLWRESVDKLAARLHRFNGRRIIAIASNPALHPLDKPDDVRSYIGRDEADYIVVPHGKQKLGEVTAWVPAMSRLSHFVTPTDFTFYGHTKGVTKDPANPAVHRWGDLMFRANLDHWDRVQDELTRHPITGVFRKFGNAFGGRVKAHYTGTFFWFRNAELFARNWRNVPQRYGGVEMLPGLLFGNDLGCHFLDATGKLLYDTNTIDEITREYDTWRLQ